MLTTIALSLVMMAGLFLMLWAEVGFIQDKRFASSAPKEELDVMPDLKPERFKGQRGLGWVLGIFGLALMVAALAVGAWDGVRSGFGFWRLFARFAFMLYALKAFDIGFFDWFLLCNSGFGFFTHYYPEVGEVLGPYLFGYNWKTHLAHLVAVVPVSAIGSWILTSIPL